MFTKMIQNVTSKHKCDIVQVQSNILNQQWGCSKPRLAAAGGVGPPLPPPPPPPLPPRGWPRLAKNGWGGNLAKIKENEEKTATLGVPRGASQPLLTCGYMCYCIWGY